VGGQDAADRGRPDPMPEAEQFALDASMPPARVLPRQPQDQLADLVADAGPAGPARVRPVPLEQPLVPRRQRRRGDDAMPPSQLPWQNLDQRREHHPIGNDNRGLVT